MNYDSIKRMTQLHKMFLKAKTFNVKLDADAILFKSRYGRPQVVLLHLWRHSLVLGWASVTNPVDHVASSSPFSIVRGRRLAVRRERFQVYLDRGCSRLQMAPSSSVPCGRRCGQKEVLDQFTVRVSCISIMSSALIVKLIHYLAVETDMDMESYD